MRFGKVIATVLAAGLLMNSLAGCGQAAKTKESSNTETTVQEQRTGEDIVTLKVFSMPSNTSGVKEGWWADILKEKAGVQLEILPSGDEGEQKLQALMASGELPDIVIFKDNKQVVNAVAGHMLLAYDDYKELLPNLYQNADNSLRYYADNVSNGEGKAFSVGTRIQTSLETKGTLNWGPYLRYDLYKQIGAPKVETSDDYLDILKKMQEIYPENENKQKVYGFSLWKDWDNRRMALGDLLGNINGISYDICGDFLELNVITNEINTIFDEDSWYLKTLKLYFDANQMGLLDPDSMTQRFDDATGKAGAGRTLFSWWGWATGGFDTTERHNQGIGFMPVEAENIKVLHQGLQPIGKNWSVSVSSATKYPEAAMRFVDFIYSEEGAMLLHNGPKGVTWDVGDDGKPYVTKEGYEYQLDTTKELPGGSNIPESQNFLNVLPLYETEMSKEYGVPIGYKYWEKTADAPADTKLEDEWQADYGAEDQIEYLSKVDGIAVAPFAPIPPIPDDLEQISGRVGDVVKTYSWKMVMAKDDAEFNQLKEEMIEKATGMDVQKVNEWYTQEYQKAYEIGKKYS